MPAAVFKLRDLAFHKAILSRMLAKAQAELCKAYEYVKKLLPRHQAKSILKNGRNKRHH